MPAAPPPSGLAALCDRAVAFHDDARRRIAVLSEQVSVGTPDPRLQAPWAHFEREVTAHFDEEERVLFPALRALDAGAPPADAHWRQQLAELDRELDEVRTIADALRAAARDAGPLETELLELLDDLEGHAEAEAGIILPAARAALLALDGPAPAPSRASAGGDPSPAVQGPPRRGRLRRLGHRLRDLLGRGG